jgi:F5/8 type C domain
MKRSHSCRRFWLCAGSVLVALAGTCLAARETPIPVEITVSLDKPNAVFDPLEALGGGVDGHQQEDALLLYKPEILKQMLSAGLHRLTYRLRTELGIQAWHWNPKGCWSDAERKCGYWISDAESPEPIPWSYGYRLPRRGNTLDEANNDGYSMLDDGDPATFWKSNPYLDACFTKEPAEAHAQWVAVFFKQPTLLNAIRIAWAAPYATRFEVEYSNKGDAAYPGSTLPGIWEKFEHGAFTGGTGGEGLLRVADRPVKVRFLRIRLLESSRTALEPDSKEVRDRLGFAIREIEAGHVDEQGVFHDAIVHQKDRQQTTIYVSSTDPWHRASDLDPGTMQPGFDLVMASGLARGQPMMVPVPVLFDTPENAAALFAHLKNRKFPIDRVELGEEPDGQRIDPRDYAALYLQVAARLREIDPKMALGGPSFVTVEGDDDNEFGGFHRGHFIREFMDYLRQRNRLGDFNFLSFEWYPFNDGDKPVPPEVERHGRMLRNAVKLMRDFGVPREMPMVISEYGYSAYACQPEVDMAGALLNAEIACEFLALGGAASYLYGYEPAGLQNDWGTSWGNLTMLLRDAKGGIRAPTATYHSSRLITQEWACPEGGRHTLYPTAIHVEKGTKPPGLAVYPLQRPDGRWAILFINKEPNRSFALSLKFEKGGKEMPSPLAGRFERLRFSSAEYAWKVNAKEGYPLRSEPASCLMIDAQPSGPATVLPKWSLMVLRSETSGR